LLLVVFTLLLLAELASPSERFVLFVVELSSIVFAVLGGCVCVVLGGWWVVESFAVVVVVVVVVVGRSVGHH
jgi:hypothetical protein